MVMNSSGSIVGQGRDEGTMRPHLSGCVWHQGKNELGWKSQSLSLPLPLFPTSISFPPSLPPFFSKKGRKNFPWIGSCHRKDSKTQESVGLGGQPAGWRPRKSMMDWNQMAEFPLIEGNLTQADIWLIGKGSPTREWWSLYTSLSIQMLISSPNILTETSWVTSAHTSGLCRPVKLTSELKPSGGRWHGLKLGKGRSLHSWKLAAVFGFWTCSLDRVSLNISQN